MEWARNMRVYVREPRAADAEAFIEKNRESLSLHRPWVYPMTTQAGYEAYLDRLGEDRYEGYLVCRKRDDEIVGAVNLSEIIRSSMNGAFVGYWGYQGYTGRGYLTEGLALVFDQAFRSLGLHRLEINIQPTNTSSISLARRLGLRKEGFSPKYLNIGGEWRDHERWAVLVDEWAEKGGSLWVRSRKYIERSNQEI